MFKWLTKLFMKEKEENETSDMEQKADQVAGDIATIISNNAPIAPKKRKHKLEIQVYEADYEKADANNGQPLWRPVRSDPVLDGGRPNIIEVADKNELAEIQKQYAMCDQRIKVIREIDPFDDEPAPPKKQVIPQNNQAIPVVQNLRAAEQVQQPLQVAQQAVQISTTVVKPKPKIITIGDMQVKYDGDKVYQKQWVKLNSNEAANFRIVNDSNNKIVPLNGKHIECRKWVIVEEDSSEDENDVMNSIGD